MGSLVQGVSDVNQDINLNTTPPDILPPDILALLGNFERLIYGHQTEPALKAAAALLDEVFFIKSENGLLANGSPTQVRALYTRMAAALSALFLAPDIRLTLPFYQALCRGKDLIQFLFSASGYGGTADLIEMFSEPHTGTNRRIGANRLLILLAFISLDDMPPDLLEVAIRQPANLLQPLLLGWLSQTAVLTAQGETNRSHLLASGAFIENQPLAPSYAGLAVSAWMYSSYASSPHKHAIKRILNKIYLRELESMDIQCATRRQVERPTLLVVGERFTIGHAMMRCYVPVLKQLAQRFRLTLLAQETLFDESSASMFEDVIVIPAQYNQLSDIVNRVAELKPDMIYYPSVGMVLWSIQLANLRLAPIQFMSLGHPATSMSEHMDYVLLPRGIEAHEGVYSEIAIHQSEYLQFAMHHALPEGLRSMAGKGKPILDIAINSSSMKLSHRLLDICERLTNATSQSLRFHFFSTGLGVSGDGLRALLMAHFPDAVVHPYQPYAKFMHLLEKCDICLASFPFGNTNSTIDAFLLGMPVVAFVGPEPHSQTDKLVMDTVGGLPAWLLADSDEAYFQAALRLITNEEERLAIADSLTSERVQERLFGGESASSRSDFSDDIWWLYENHERIQASGRRALPAGETV